jgi:L-ascorbate metabolism protein UlaG (beta-lactamase superfamily)
MSEAPPRNPPALTVTMIRCSTLLLEWDGLRLLTDPWFAMHLRGLPCFRRPGLAPRALGALDAVLVSHLHPDHLDPAAMSRIHPAPARVLLPPGSLGLPVVRRIPAPVQELAPWQSTKVRDATVWAVPGPHTLPGPEEVNYVVDVPGWGRLFFGGDARFDGPALVEIARRFAPFRVALLPVGGTRILGRRTVMNPADAWRAARLLDAGLVVPIHEGGIWLSVPPLSLHPGRAAHLAALAARDHEPDRVVVLREGQRLRVDAATPSRPPGTRPAPDRRPPGARPR